MDCEFANEYLFCDLFVSAYVTGRREVRREQLSALFVIEKEPQQSTKQLSSQQSPTAMTSNLH